MEEYEGQEDRDDGCVDVGPETRARGTHVEACQHRNWTSRDTHSYSVLYPFGIVCMSALAGAAF